MAGPVIRRSASSYLAAVCAISLAASATAAVQTKEITYRHGETELQGFLAWDDAAKEPRPGVIVVHEWWGHNQHARNQAVRLAKDGGYVGFALDMYGKGKVTRHPADAQAFAAEATKDPALVKARFEAALAVLRQTPGGDPQRCVQLGAALAAVRAERFARQALGVQAHRHILRAKDLALDNSDMFLAILIIRKGDNVKIAKARRQFCNRFDVYADKIPVNAFASRAGIFLQHEFDLFVC